MQLRNHWKRIRQRIAGKPRSVFHFETLERRCVLSANLGTEATPNLLVVPNAASSATIFGYPR
jgi:hypothetical protein